jgi:hypothetical protein
MIGLKLKKRVLVFLMLVNRLVVVDHGKVRQAEKQPRYLRLGQLK